jgi:hypothetical protein
MPPLSYSLTLPQEWVLPLRAKVPSSDRQEGLQFGIPVEQKGGEGRGGMKLSCHWGS